MSDLAQIYGEAVRDYQPTGPGTEQAAHLAGLQAVRRAVLLEAAKVCEDYAGTWESPNEIWSQCASAIRALKEAQS